MPMNRIYALIDPRDGEIRYVGITCNPVRRRLREHLRYAERGGKTHRCKWIRLLLSLGLEPTLLVLEETEQRNREQCWIAFYRAAGMALTNLTDGGDGSTGRRLTKDEIERRTAARAGYQHSEETRRRISRANKGRTMSAAWIGKMAATKRGKKSMAAAAMTHCKRGHLLSGENLRIETSGSRRCLACHRDTDRRYREKDIERTRALARERMRRHCAHAKGKIDDGDKK